MFISEEVFPKIPAKLNLSLLPEFEEQKEEELNPAADYGKLNAEFEEVKCEEQQVTVLPLEQAQVIHLEHELSHCSEEVVWKDPYYVTSKCAYKRIVQVKDKTKKQQAKIYYRQTKLKNMKFPEKKRNNKSKYDFDVSNWKFK